MGLREKFGRPLRLAIVGGGLDSWIGNMHRGAAEMDGWFRTTAGVFSSDPARCVPRACNWAWTRRAATAPWPRC